MTTGSGQFVVEKWKSFRIEYHAFPRIFFNLVQALLVTLTIELGFQPPIKLQEAKFASSYKIKSYPIL